MWKYVESILHGMKLRQSYLQDGFLRMMHYEWWPYNGQMYMFFFAFGQCRHVKSSMMSDFQLVAIYWTATIFILHCICIVFL